MAATDPHRGTHRAIEAVWRIESARLIAGLTRIIHDVGAAEELAQDALVIALEQWPRSGVPPNPGGWLMSTAKHRAIDLLRRRATYDSKLQELGRDLEIWQEDRSDLDTAIDDPIGDDLLRLIFIACHPVLSTQARVALTLRLLGGLSTDEIARAFLVSEPAVAQRIVRAKRTLADKRVPSWSSTVRSRSGWPPGPSMVWRSSMRSHPSLLLTTTPSYRPYGAICWPRWAVSTRRSRNSGAPRTSPETNESAPCSSIAPPPVHSNENLD